MRRGTVHALIGPNGSGKSTFINVVTGLYRPTAGRINFGGRDITGFAPHERNRAGLARTFQNIRVFRGMTVLENVMVGAERPGNDVANDAGEVVRRALAALDFVDLRRDAHRMVGTLSYGHQRYVEIARALAGSPDVLLLDEPAAGLNMTEKTEMGALLLRLKGHGMTILIIDHDMKLVEQVADHITVLNFGRRIADGGPARRAHPPRGHRRLFGRAAAGGRGCGMKLLELGNLVARYGAADVLKGLDISVDEGEIVALLGSNGAGKSTTPARDLGPGGECLRQHQPGRPVDPRFEARSDRPARHQPCSGGAPHLPPASRCARTSCSGPPTAGRLAARWTARSTR